MKRSNGFERLRSQVTLLRRSAVENRKNASRIVFAIARGETWQDVKNIETLEIDKPYIIRRVYKAPAEKKRIEDPVAALWTSAGWKFLSGRILQDTGSYSSIEVWI